ncbi:DUF742 domain-containing protein [Paractinoplanes ferrugineus]|uniref:DUF742 domain-containing protein n=1 Tax=Paractinoplanes ferrugineus TaxID=113564 RepID=A0A919MFK7_9ACTN|nr:DUF742 domain-containing protein [Actinoplanes ferrugineus]GIE10680.1 hypothetical protein Afe05nite_25200 [Actinoplanes ferrugineus]
MATHPGYARHWKVRPYMRAASGRVGTGRRPLLIHTLVSTGGRFDPMLAATLAPATRRLYEAARTMCSVAELSAHCGLSLGVTRVLVSDLLKTNELILHDDRPTDVRPSNDVALLERLRAGLRKLT